MTTQTVTPARAEGCYNAAMEKIRERHERGDRWDIAVAHMVMGLSEWEASVIFDFLKAQKLLAMVDRLLADCLAKRLGFEIEWKRVELVS